LPGDLAPSYPYPRAVTFLAVREVSSFAAASQGYAGMFDVENIACGFAMWR